MSNGSPSYLLPVVILALLGVVIAGLLGMRGGRGRNIAEYFTGGHPSGWRNLAASLFVTTLWGGWSAGSELSFGGDILWWGLLACAAIAGLMLLGVVFAPAYRKTGVMTIPAFLGKRYGDERVRVAVSVSLVVLTLFVRIPLTIILGGRMLNSLFGWDPMTSALLMIVVPGYFAVAGGFAGMMAVHGAASAVAVVGLLSAGATGLAGSHLLSPLTESRGGSGGMMLLAGLLLNMLWTTCLDQSVVQRAMAAGSATRRGAFRAAGAIGCIAVVFMLLVMWRPVDPVPGSLLGSAAVSLLGSAILALAMAILSADFLSVSTLFTMDLFGRVRKHADESAFVLAGRLTATVSVLVSILAASLLALLGEKAVPWLLEGYVVLVAPVVTVALMLFVWQGVGGRAALWAVAAGWIAGALHWTVAPGLMPLRMSMLLTALVLFGVTGVVFIGVSLLSSGGSAGRRVFVGKRVEAGKQ